MKRPACSIMHVSDSRAGTSMALRPRRVARSRNSCRKSVRRCGHRSRSAWPGKRQAGNRRAFQGSAAHAEGTSEAPVGVDRATLQEPGSRRRRDPGTLRFMAAEAAPQRARSKPHWSESPHWIGSGPCPECGTRVWHRGTPEAGRCKWPDFFPAVPQLTRAEPSGKAAAPRDRGSTAIRSGLCLRCGVRR